MSEYLDRLINIRKDNEQAVVLEDTTSRVVIAGPGAGKTYLLTTKAAKLLHENIVQPPQKIACLTFSRLLQQQLEDDFKKLGILDRERLFIGTVHSFCIAEIIFPFKHVYNLDIPSPFRISSDKEKILALELALSLQHKKLPKKESEQGNLRRDIEKYRRLHWGSRLESFDECSEISRVSYPDLNWHQIAMDYIEILRNGKVGQKSIDFVEVELIASQTVEKSPLVQKVLAAHYPWWLIDEYQDLGKPFHDMITKLLRNTNSMVIAIGDRNQCIFEELQGSKPEFIDNLANVIRTEQAGNETQRLLTNYRCTQEIIDLSEIIFGEKIGYKSGFDQDGAIYLIKSHYEHYNVVIKRLLELLVNRDDGPKFRHDQILILHPFRKSLNNISEYLDRIGWPNSLDKDPDYSTETRGEFVEWIEMLAKWCTTDLQGSNFNALLPKWRELNNPVEFDRGQFAKEKKLFDTLWKLRQPVMKLSDWLDRIDEGLNLQELLQRHQEIRPDDVYEFDKLVAETRKTNSRLSKWSLKEFARIGARTQLTTVHSSKGSQYEAVIIAGYDGLAHRYSSNPKLFDRLAYVGVTRAKTRLFLLYYDPRSIYVRRIISNKPDCINHYRFERNKFTPL